MVKTETKTKSTFNDRVFGEIIPDGGIVIVKAPQPPKKEKKPQTAS